MIIEFMGLPGSGKTRLHEVARKIIEERGFAVWDPDQMWNSVRKYKEKSAANGLTGSVKFVIRVVLNLFPQLPQIFRFCRKHFSFVLGVLWMILSNPSAIRTRILLLKYLLIDICQYATINGHDGKTKVVLVDEGFIQHIFTNLAQKLHNRDFQKGRWYIRNAPLPNLLIYVRTSPETCLQRMQARGFPRRLQNEPIDVIKTMLSTGNELFEFVYGIVERISHGMTKAYALNSKPSLEMTGILLAHLETLAHG
ncbi:MAG: AAA family ATPase [Deltaproteobacteria bacterium]|nr:AAA family ATPase [Deltaproteobacteria bacterium]